MSSPLTITYTSPTATGSTPTAATGADAPASDNPLGFLAALVDQLLAGGGVSAQPTDGGTDTSQQAGAGLAPAAPAANPDISALLNLASTDATSAAAPVPASPAPAPAAPLFADLVKDLDALKQQLDAGETPDPDLLKKLGQVADALVAMLNAPPQLAQTTPAPEATANAVSALDPLKAIAASATVVTQKPAVDTGLKQLVAKQVPIDQLTQILSSLGFTAPETASSDDAAPTTSAPAATTSQPLPALAQLVDKLAQFTASLAPVSPETAQKLQTLTQKLATAEADPTTLAQLTAPSDTDGQQLDQIVRTLLDNKPASTVPATPQLATTTKLDVPADVAPVELPKAKAEPKTTTAEAKPAPHASAKLTEHVAETVAPKPQADSKSVAAVISARTDDAPAPDANTTQQSTATPVTAAAQAPAPVAPRAIPAAYQAAANPINMGQVAFEMVRQLHQGQSRFSIRIDPPELGRVDVKMHVDATGTVNARLTVERSETLDMFQRDRGALEKALTQAGLDSGKTNLEFSLKQQNNPFAQMAGGDQRQNGGANGGFKFSTAREDDVSAVPAVTLYRGTASAGGVNLFV